MSERTKKALLARGIDIYTTEQLVSRGCTLAKLQKLTDFTLYNLTAEQISKLQKGSRPPIPTPTLDKLLYKSAYTCCICRKKDNPIIVHHIIEWSKSRSHKETNLVVLCLNCHSKAHSTNTISVNLTIDRINKSKSEWENTVKKHATNALFKKSSWNLMDNGIWDYFNHQRIIDVAYALELDLSTVENYNSLLNAGIIDQSGGYIWPTNYPRKNAYLYDDYTIFNRTMVNYYAALTKKILENAEWYEISNNFRKSAINRLNNNIIISVTGGHRFKKENNVIAGKGQMVTGYKQGNGLKVIFSIDLWEATSCSSHYVHLSGNRRCSSILVVRDIELTKKRAIVHCTCLAIGTGFTDYIAKHVE